MRRRSLLASLSAALQRQPLGFHRICTSTTNQQGSMAAQGREVPEGFTVLSEGEAEILQHGNDVFYNKAQIVNRDMSIAVLRAFVEKRHLDMPVAKCKSRPQNGGSGGSGSGRAEQPSTPSGNEMGTSERAAPGTESTKSENAQRPLRVLEALAASGLRAIRYAREVDGIGSVLAVDNDKMAYEACQRNVAFNNLPAGAVEVQQADARLFMLSNEKAFDVVDLDPYGSPSIFLDSAVQTVADGGLLLCTATDMAVLCGNNAEVGWSKYGAYPLRGKFCHEMALRVLLACIESHANRYKRHIVPIVSLSVDFYIRVFVRVFTSASAVKQTPSKLAYVYQCVGCEAFHLQPVGRIIEKNNSVRYMPGMGPSIEPACEHCGKHFNMGGPMWAAPIHDPTWVKHTLDSVTAMKSRYPAFDKIHSILTTVSEELTDVPLYVNLHGLTATLKCTPPAALVFRSAVTNAGYRVSSTHASPLGLKTDAPFSVIWDIMRAWVKSHPVKPQPEESPGAVILSKPATIEANFARTNAAKSKAQTNKVARFLPNPEQYWGPKPKAGRHVSVKHTASTGFKAQEGANGSHAEVSTISEAAEEREAKRQKTTDVEPGVEDTRKEEDVAKEGAVPSA